MKCPNNNKRRKNILINVQTSGQPEPLINENLQNQQTTKEIFLKQFDYKKHGLLDQQEWAKIEALKFHENVREFKPYFCEKCQELWPTKNNKCDTCCSFKKKFTSENDMDPCLQDLPDDIKIVFDELTMVEEMLISPIIPIMSVYRLSGGQLISRGCVVNFKQDISEIVRELPRAIQDLPLVGQQNSSKEMKVNRTGVLRTLEFLSKNSPEWKKYNISIDHTKILNLPFDDIPDNITEVENQNDIVNDIGPEIHENIQIPDDNHVFVQSVEEKSLECEKIKEILNWPQKSKDPINEFNFDGIASLVFPKLFPFGKGDPTKKARFEKVSETNAFNHLLKYATKNPQNGLYSYPFAKHQRFKFWAYNRIC